MKINQNYIIAGMAIIIAVLCFFLHDLNSSVKIYKEEIKLEQTKKSKQETQDKINQEIKNISDKSTKTVSKSDSIIKKITHEKVKINDTTDLYMLEYIQNYSPNKD